MEQRIDAMRRGLDKLEKETLVGYLIRGYQLSLEFEAYREFLEFKKFKEPKTEIAEVIFSSICVTEACGMVVSGAGRT